MLDRPWWDTRAPTEVAHQMALLPLVWLACLAHVKKPRDAAWWWLATALAISWLADLAGDLLPPSLGWVPVLVYPVLQSSLIAAVFLPRKQAMAILGILAGVAFVVALSGGSRGPEVVSSSSARLAVVGILLIRPALPFRLRSALFVYFGVGLMAWLAHVQRLDLLSYYVYQGVRLIGLVLFCWAAIGPERSLTLHD